MFYRYNITSAADKIDALKKLAEHLAAQPKKKEDGAVVQMPNLEAAREKTDRTRTVLPEAVVSTAQSSRFS